MLGVAVLTVAIVGAIMISWAMSTDVTEQEVTRYNALADITGEFDSEKSPQYIDYSPSTNYTGYYTDDSVIGDKRYFDGVDYTESTPNNYRLNLPPTTDVSGTLNMSSQTPDDSPLTLLYWTNTDTFYAKSTNHITFSAYAATITSAYDELYIVSSFTSYATGGFITFVPYNYASGQQNNILMKDPSLTGPVHYRDEPNSQNYIDIDDSRLHVPILAAKYDATTRTLELFYDREMTDSAGIYQPDKVWILWDPDSGEGFHLGSTATTRMLDFPNPSYMDPSQGVSLE